MIQVLFFLYAAKSQGIRVCFEFVDAGTDEFVGSLQFVIEFFRPFCQDSEDRGVVNFELSFSDLFLVELLHLRRDLLIDLVQMSFHLFEIQQILTCLVILSDK